MANFSRQVYESQLKPEIQNVCLVKSNRAGFESRSDCQKLFSNYDIHLYMYMLIMISSIYEQKQKDKKHLAL